MLRYFFVLFIFVANTITAQESLNCNLLYNWDSDTVPGSFAYNNSFNEVWGMEINGREYAVMGSTIGTHIFDVTDPDNATPLFYVEGAFSSPQVVHRDYHDYQGYLYAACDEGNSTLQIIDVSNLPESIEVVYDSNQLMSRAHNLFIDEQNAVLYAAGGSQELSLFSLENPENPTPILNCQQDVVGWSQIGYVHDLYVRDGIAYCHAGDGMYIVDFSDTSSPQFLGSITSYQDQGYNHSGWLNDEGTIYAMADETTGTRIKILDVSNPSDINVLSVVGTSDYLNSIPHNVIFTGNKLHVSYYSDGYYLFDISDPQNPELEAFYHTCTFGNGCVVVDDGAWGVYPLLPSGNILVSDQQNGLFVLNVPSLDATAISEENKNAPENYFFDGESIQLFGLNTAEKTTISIYNSLGEITMTRTTQGKSSMRIPTNRLPNGIYFVNLHEKNKEKTFKIIKQ